MKFMSGKPISLMAILFAATALAGCAATQQRSQEPSSQGSITQEEHQAHHPQGAAAQPSGTTGQGGMMGGGQGGMMGGGQGGMMGGGQGGMMGGGQGGMMGGGQGGMMGGGQGGMMGQGGAAGQMDMKSMCEMRDRMRNARTPEERSAMMNERMKNMSPEMRQRYMEMMQQQCR